MKFIYKAKLNDGIQESKGTIDAPNKSSAISKLRSSGLFVYSLQPIKEKSERFNIVSFLEGVSLSEKVKFTDQMASMLNAGLPITKSLELLSSQTKNHKMGQILQAVLSDVESGAPLSKAIQNQGTVFSASYISLLRAGEATGKVDEVMRRLADTLEKQREFGSRVKGAMIYPAIITSAMVMVFFLIVVFVIPKMSAIYDSFDIDLPFMTKALIALSDFLVGYWWIAIALILSTITGIRIFATTNEGEIIFSTVGLKLPIFGEIIRQSTIVELTRTLGLLDEAGVPIIEALAISKNSMKNRLFRDSIDRFIDDVKHGLPLSQSIDKEKIYPQMVAQMLVVGEETGTVGERLNGLAKYYEGEVDKVVKNLSTAMEPLIMLMLGVMVGVLIISVIMPIYQLTSQF